MDNKEDLIDKLERIRIERGMTLLEMAVQLGFRYQQNWLFVKDTHTFSVRTLMHIRRNFPELAGDIDDFLLHEDINKMITPNKHKQERRKYREVTQG